MADQNAHPPDNKAPDTAGEIKPLIVPTLLGAGAALIFGAPIAIGAGIGAAAAWVARHSK
jgi:ABC-type phosphate transport system permease subunit